MISSPKAERPIDLLLSKLLDARLDGGEQEELTALLEHDPQARQSYHEHIGLHATLHWIDSEPLKYAPREPVLTAAAPSVAPVLGFLGGAVQGTMSYMPQGWTLAYLIATVVSAIGLTIGHLTPVSTSEQLARDVSLPARSRQEAQPALVGRVTRALDCQPQTDTPLAGVGARVEIGQHIGLDAGLLEIAYDTGAKVVLQGPVQYEVASASSGYLSLGRLTAKLRKKKTGSPKPFAVCTPAATIVDLGTEFGVEVDKGGATRSYVLVGTVRVEPSVDAKNARREMVVLHARDSAWVQRTSAGEGAKVVVHHNVALPAHFAGPDPFAQAEKNRLQQRLQRRQAYAERICRDPDLVVYYDFQRQDSPGVVHGVGPGAKGALDGVIQRKLTWDSVALLVSDANLLRGKPAVASSTYVDANTADHNYPALRLTDDAEMPHVFAEGDMQQRLVIHGLNSPLGVIRLWRSEDRVAQQVTIKSSLIDTSSLDAANYDTTLASLTSLSFNDMGYADIAVKAPAGTRSLFFDFGNRTEYYPAGGWPQPAGIRTMEIQGFASPPTSSVASLVPAWSQGRVPGTTALPLDTLGMKTTLPQRLTQMTLAAWLTVGFIDDECVTCDLLSSEGWRHPDGSPEKLHWQIGRMGEIHFGAATSHFTTHAVLPWPKWNRNRWRHLAVVADPAQQRLACYLDGKPIHAEKLAAGFAGVFGVAGMGSWRSADGRVEHGLHGRMDELLILARAMTDQEITDLYEAGKP